MNTRFGYLREIKRDKPVRFHRKERLDGVRSGGGEAPAMIVSPPMCNKIHETGAGSEFRNSRGVGGEGGGEESWLMPDSRSIRSLHLFRNGCQPIEVESDARGQVLVPEAGSIRQNG